MVNSFIVNIDGCDINVIAEIIDKKIWFKLNEQTYSYNLIALAQSDFNKIKTSSKSPELVLAPMPGKVIKLFVSPGQRVSKGDTLLVMEAMKMEYTLRSDIAATVEKIFSQVGDQVILGHLLIQLNEDK